MIIPIRCFTCGNVLADKYKFYLKEVRSKKMSKQGENDNMIDVSKIMYLTKDNHQKTPEGEVMDELELFKMCCRRHMLTHVDIE